MKNVTMKYVSAILLAVLFSVNLAYAGGDDKSGIKWMNWDEVQVAMKKEPKKVWVDVYTDWCGWCKVMDRKTFSNPDVIKYMNDNFYAVKFNAEQREDIMFMGQVFKFEPEYKANKLAALLMNGQMSYPTNVFMEENFQNPYPIPGYQPVTEIEKVLKYLGEGHYKNTSFEEYLKTFKQTWSEQS